MLRTNDAVLSAFHLLVSTVRDFYSNRRPCLGATLKPELYRRANFSEQILGFPKFGDFLRAAEAAGHVQLSATPGGDIEVWPVGIRIPARPARPTSGFAHSLVPAGRSWSLGPSFTAPVRVRQDLWNAFNSFSVDWVYDPGADIAYKESNTAGESEAEGLPTRLGLIKIPAARDRVLEWMRSFTNMQDPQTKAQLSTVFEGVAAPYRFNNLVRSDTRLLRAWGRFRVQQVLAAIEAWAASNNVQPKDVTGPLHWPVRPTAPQIATPLPPATSVPQVAPTTSQPAPSHLTGRLESLIDDLIDELVKLRGFLQVVGPKQH